MKEIKTVILAGGKGSRLNEETSAIPKPMVRIGNIPIIEHVMNIYSDQGFTDFILCLGYKQEIIKQYFLDYNLNNSDFSIDLSTNTITKYNYKKKNWKITFVDTGEETLTGGRLLKVKNYLQNDRLFLLTYADGVSNVDIKETIKFHTLGSQAATLTAVQKAGKFGTFQMNGNFITSFKEKPIDDYINGGFFCMSNKVFDYLKDEDLPDTLDRLAKDKQLVAYKHHGEWECMDTINDKMKLEEIWNSGNAFWEKNEK